MKLNVLAPFLAHAANSRNPKIKTAASSLLDGVLDAQHAEEIIQPSLEQEDAKPNALDAKSKDEIDTKITTWMPDITKKTELESNFGKTASSFSSDVVVSSLPKDTQKDIVRFVNDTKTTNKVVQYGMVVDELLPKVDDHNYTQAKQHIQKDLKEKGKRNLGDLFQEKNQHKYVLLMNDKIVDGHHFLALAEVLGISCSLRTLDLTPLRFQCSKQASLYHVLHEALS